MSTLPKPPAAFTSFQTKYPAIATAWEQLSTAGEHGPLDEKTQRLVKLGIAIGSMRKGAVNSAARKDLAAGVPRDAIDQVIALAATTIGLPPTVAVFSWIQGQMEKLAHSRPPPLNGVCDMKLINRITMALSVVLLVAPLAHGQGKKMIEGTGVGTIKGKITFDGVAPVDAKLKIDANHKDASHCLKDDTADLTWVVSADKGLGNVVVFLKPPAGTLFKVDLSKKTWPDEVVIDQPFCAFKPHVSVVFPEYDGKRTGQKFIVKNSAPILHNSRVVGSSFKNPAKNETLAAGKDKALELKADTQVLKINCDAHKWMEAYIWSFEHPYAAVTKADGTFEIKNVPTGVEVSVIAWHEVGTPAVGKEVKKGMLKDGETIDFTIKK